MAKTKALISIALTAKLICAFLFTYADYLFSHAAAQFQINISALILVSVLFERILVESCLLVKKIK